MASNKGLGKGLGALFGDIPEESLRTVSGWIMPCSRMDSASSASLSSSKILRG